MTPTIDDSRGARPRSSNVRYSIGAGHIDRNMQIAVAIDVRVQRITPGERSDPLRRAGVDEIACPQVHILREPEDDFGGTPNQLAQRTALTNCPVDGEPDGTVSGDRTAIERCECTAWRRVIERLAHIPRPALLFRLHLQIAAG